MKDKNPSVSADEVRKSHRETLARFRIIINTLLDKLEEDMAMPDAPENDACKFWWGSRESAVSVLTKLAQIFLKIVPAEQKLMGAEEDDTEEILSSNDYDIIQRYVEKISQQHTEA